MLKLTFGRLQQGKGLIKVNGKPLALMQPEILRFKVYEPVLILGLDKFAQVDIRVRVTGGGHTSQVYAIRQAIAKSIVAYYQKYVDEYTKNQLKQALVQYDRTLLVADNRRCEPKKFGGPVRTAHSATMDARSDLKVDGGLLTCWLLGCSCKIPEVLPLEGMHACRVAAWWWKAYGLAWDFWLYSYWSTALARSCHD